MSNDDKFGLFLALAIIMILAFAAYTTRDALEPSNKITTEEVR